MVYADTPFKHSQRVTKNLKLMKYLLLDDGVFSLKSGTNPLDRSLFRDTELDTCEPDLTLMTQRTERKHFTTGDTLVSFEKV